MIHTECEQRSRRACKHVANLRGLSQCTDQSASHTYSQGKDLVLFTIEAAAPQLATLQVCCSLSVTMSPRSVSPAACHLAACHLAPAAGNELQVCSIVELRCVLFTRTCAEALWLVLKPRHIVCNVPTRPVLLMRLMCALLHWDRCRSEVGGSFRCIGKAEALDDHTQCGASRSL